MNTLRFAFVLLAAAMLLPQQTSAQTLIGAKAGVNFAEQSFSAEGASVSPDSRTGFVGGAFAQFALGSPWYLQPEVLYSSKGWKSEGDALKLDYLEVPVLFGAAFPLENSSLRPSVFAGPVVAFKLNCDADGEDCGDLYKSVDFGLVFGGGLAFAAGSVDLFIDGRYNLGLTDVLDDDGLAEGVSVKNRAWQFMAGVGFPVGS